MQDPTKPESHNAAITNAALAQTRLDTFLSECPEDSEMDECTLGELQGYLFKTSMEALMDALSQAGYPTLNMSSEPLTQMGKGVKAHAKAICDNVASKESSQSWRWFSKCSNIAYGTVEDGGGPNGAPSITQLQLTIYVKAVDDRGQIQSATSHDIELSKQDWAQKGKYNCFV